MTSSLTCEKNWSEYAFIHSAKRNRLGTQKAQDLEFVHSNLHLLSRQQLEYQIGPSRMKRIFIHFTQVNVTRTPGIFDKP